MALAVFLLAGCAARRKAAEVPEKEKVEQVGVNREEILSRIRAAGFQQDSTERKITLTVGGKSVTGSYRVLPARASAAAPVNSNFLIFCKFLSPSIPIIPFPAIFDHKN